MPGTVLRRTRSPRALADDPVARRIRALRLEKGWSLKRLSEATQGLAPSFLFNIENGTKVASVDVALRIAHALDDAEHEDTYRAWALVKSRGRNGRMDHEAMAKAWETLRNPFRTGAAVAESAPDPVDAGPTRDLGRLRVPVLASAVDPGDEVRPPSEYVINTLSLDPLLYGHDAEQARDRFVKLRRPFAFPLGPEHAARAGLPVGYLAIVTREPLTEPRPTEAYVLRHDGRLEVATGMALMAAHDKHPAVIGRIDMLLPDVRR